MPLPYIFYLAPRIVAVKTENEEEKDGKNDNPPNPSCITVVKTISTITAATVIAGIHARVVATAIVTFVISIATTCRR